MTKQVKVRCPECHKYIMANQGADGEISCQCPNCKVVFFSKMRGEHEKLIRIRYRNNKDTLAKQVAVGLK